MLRSLVIRNFILVEEAHIEFDEGFTVLTGETGAGKSAIMKAIRLVLGAKPESGMVRQGCEKATVEAAFDVGSLPALKEAGIAHEKGELLILRRDLSATGPSRSYINNQMAQRATLQAIGASLLDFVGQHASQRLLSLDYHRAVVDLYGQLDGDREAYAARFYELRRLEEELAQLETSEASRLREIEQCRRELEEIDEANINDGEEEELFGHYSLLANHDQISRQLDDALTLLTDGEAPVVPALHRISGGLSELPAGKSLGDVAVELDEIARELQGYRNKLDFNPQRMAEIDDRLKVINGLKRRYGDAVNDYADKQRARLDTLDSADMRIEELKVEVDQVTVDVDRLAARLTDQRSQAARGLEEALLTHLHPLNMKGAHFEIRLEKSERNHHGDDRLEFFFAPNPGERMSPLRESASGGELSRVLLALKTALAGLELTPTLLFDEIDANIGGETARLVGEKLVAIAEKRQVLSISHLAQVASLATHHFRIHKETADGRTASHVTKLVGAAKKEELVRMTGLTKMPSSSN